MILAAAPVSAAAATKAPPALPATFSDSLDRANAQIGYGVMGYHDQELWPGDFTRLRSSADAAERLVKHAVGLPDATPAGVQHGRAALLLFESAKLVNPDTAVKVYGAASSEVWEAWRAAT